MQTGQRPMHLPRQLQSLFVSLVLFFALATAALGQTITPDVQVAGTGIVDGSVTILQATVEGPGWVVIHIDADGNPGAVIGHAPLMEGVNSDVVVEIDEDAATPILFAMLHVDEGEVGAYEFPGPDVPVKIGDNIVQARFSAAPVVAEPETVTPTAMPATGAGPSTLLILALMVVALVALGVTMLRTQRGSVQSS